MVMFSREAAKELDMTSKAPPVQEKEAESYLYELRITRRDLHLGPGRLPGKSSRVIVDPSQAVSLMIGTGGNHVAPSSLEKETFNRFKGGVGSEDHG